MWHREGLHHLRRAIKVTHRSSLNTAYCFVWNEKQKRAQLVPQNSKNLRAFQFLYFSIIFILEPILLIRCYQLRHSSYNADDELVLKAYFTFPVALLVWMLIPLVFALASSTGRIKFVRHYEALSQLEVYLAGGECKFHFEKNFQSENFHS